MSTYAFGSADQSVVVRDGTLWIPWDVAHERPATSGHVYNTWVADGSPTPTVYIPVMKDGILAGNPPADINS